jgi:hypothetical protein
MGTGPAAATLIEQDDSVCLGVEVPPHRGAATAARAAMDDYHGYAVGVAALFHIDPMPPGHVEHALVKRVQRGVKDL